MSADRQGDRFHRFCVLWERPQTATRRQLPQANRIVTARRQRATAVRAERDRTDLVPCLVSSERPQTAARRQLPQAKRIVSACRQSPAAVWAERDRTPVPRLSPLEGPQTAARPQLPQAKRIVKASRQGPAAIRADGNRTHSSRVALEHLQAAARRQFPQAKRTVLANRPVPAPRQGPAAVRAERDRMHAKRVPSQRLDAPSGLQALTYTSGAQLVMQLQQLSLAFIPFDSPGFGYHGNRCLITTFGKFHLGLLNCFASRFCPVAQFSGVLRNGNGKRAGA